MYFVCFIIFVVYYYPAILLLLLILGLFFIGHKLLSKGSGYSGSTVVKNSKANYRSGYVCDEMEWDEDLDCDDCDWYEEPVKSEKKSFDCLSNSYDCIREFKHDFSIPND